MSNTAQFYIDGAWVAPLQANPMQVINPATEKVIGTISIGSAADADRAVKAARKAFASYAQTTVAQRQELLQSIIAVYKRRMDNVAAAVSMEMGAPLEKLAKRAQAPAAISAHLRGVEQAAVGQHLRSNRATFVALVAKLVFEQRLFGQQ